MSHNTKSSPSKKVTPHKKTVKRSKFVNSPFKGTSPVYSLNKDCIGRILDFLSYHDWATIQRTAQLFHHKEHDQLRKNAESMIKVGSNIILKPIHCYLGKSIDTSPKRLKKEIARVFKDFPLDKGLCLQGDIVLRSLLGLQFTGMEICVGTPTNFGELLANVKLEVKRVTIKISDSYSTLVIDCQDDYRITLVEEDVHLIPFFFTPSHTKEHLYKRKVNAKFRTTSGGIRTLMTGLAFWLCDSIYDYRCLAKYGLKASNKMAIMSDISVFGNFKCQHNYYETDSRGIVKSPVSFVFEAPLEQEKKKKVEKVGKTKTRLLILADYKGHQVDILTREVYNPETKAICGKISKKGVFKGEACILEPVGDTEIKALKPKTCQGQGTCHHPFIYREYTGNVVNDLSEYSPMPEKWLVLGSKLEALKLLEKLEEDDDMFEEIPKLKAQGVFKRLGGKVGFRSFRDLYEGILPGATDNNFEFWKEEFTKLEGYEWLTRFESYESLYMVENDEEETSKDSLWKKECKEDEPYEEEHTGAKEEVSEDESEEECEHVQFVRELVSATEEKTLEKLRKLSLKELCTVFEHAKVMKPRDVGFQDFANMPTTIRLIEEEISKRSVVDEEEEDEQRIEEHYTKAESAPLPDVGNELEMLENILEEDEQQMDEHYTKAERELNSPPLPDVGNEYV